MVEAMPKEPFYDPGPWGVLRTTLHGVDVWAANQMGILHYDGTSWTGPSPGSGTQSWWVRGIWARDGNVFAVGSRDGMGLLLRSTDRGKTWSEMVVPEIIYAVWGRSGNEAYAVGAGGVIYRLPGPDANVRPAVTEL